MNKKPNINVVFCDEKEIRRTKTSLKRNYILLLLAFLNTKVPINRLSNLKGLFAVCDYLLEDQTESLILKNIYK